MSFGGTLHKRVTEWIAMKTTHSIPPGSLIGGVDRGRDMYIIRARYAGNVIPGKLAAYPSCCYGWIAYCGVELHVQEFQILKMPSEYAIWKPVHEGTTFDVDLMANAVEGGYSTEGTPYFIGRVPFDGTVSIGKVDPQTGKLFLPYGGSEYEFADYEVLCYNSWNIDSLHKPATLALTDSNENVRFSIDPRCERIINV